MDPLSTTPPPRAKPRSGPVLGIETSCDETAVALVAADRTVLAEALWSQIEEHAPYGGIVPEIAARAHLERTDRLILRVMAEAGLGFADLAAVAATAGPGLIGGLLVGLVTAKAIALVHDLPLVAVNHLEGHALTARLTDGLAFPYLLLLVSGGHCQFQEVLGVGRYGRLGTTIDDALGEALDKLAKMLDLPQPGGPAVEQLALTGDPARFALPRPLAGRPGCHLSFSGLKTAARQTLLAAGDEARGPGFRADLAASFQAAAFDSLLDRTGRAIGLFRKRHPDARDLVVAGGVAANRVLRARLHTLAQAEGMRLVLPPPRLCTDNGVMIAWAGQERLALGLVDGLDAPARARWPLDPEAEPAIGAGVKA
jgi:N6-L-threonylcarbamoyladenine synthase